ncbi:response regulator [Cohnella laeviribosi]|uniref:response regulator transcription factor n=1 Tax=Cohnella laeviribosi TaxID=380174 RepID=UPI003D1DC1E9
MYKYIIVDDEPSIRRGMRKKIDSFPGELSFCGEADNGEDALALIRSADPDIILTDMRMPVMDGKLLLRTLQQDYPDKKIIIISGYSDFEYMREAISAKVVGYLLKPFSREEIHEALRKAVAALDKDNASRREAETSNAEKEQISLQADLQALAHLMVGLHPKDKLPEFRSGRLRDFLDAPASFIVLTIYGKQGPETAVPGFAGENELYIAHPQSEQMGMVLLRFAGQSQAQAMADDADMTAAAVGAAQAWIARCESSGQGRAVVGISGIHGSAAELRRAYEETLAVLDARPIGDGKRFVVYRQEAPAPLPAVWDRADDLLFYVESGNAARVEELIADLFDSYARRPDLPLAALKEQCRQIVQEVKNALAGYFQTPVRNSPSSSFEAVMSVSFEPEEIRQYMSGLLSDITGLFKENSPYSSDSLIDNIKTYIQKNYGKDLTLDRVASLFYLNPSYLSYLFKEKTGENFTDYTNRLRIEHAKRLLAETDEKVYKIAKTLGFDNDKYFFRLFKKLTGFTPEQYRSNRS